MFFNNKENNDEKDYFIKIAALLIHAAKIDENFTVKEEHIIKQTLLEIGAKKENLEKLMNEAKKNEENSNQILNYTKEVKNMSEDNKVKIIECLWRIIYSNNDADIYETNLMRRLAGLLYIDNKMMVDIRDKVKKQNS